MLCSKFGRVFSVLFALSFEGWAAGVAPALREVNLGPIPIDVYNNAQFRGLLPACKDANGDPRTTWTAQDCINSILGDDPGSPYFNRSNYRRQGVTGVRFMFAVGGGFYSTPFDAEGTVRQERRDRLKDFFADLWTYGITRVTPTPMLTAPWTVDRSGYPIFQSDLTIATDAVLSNIRVAGLDDWSRLWTAEFGTGDSGGWGSWDLRSGTVQAISAAQLNGWFYVYARTGGGQAWRYSLEKEEWANLNGVAMGQPAAT